MGDESDRPGTKGDAQDTALPCPRNDRGTIRGIICDAKDDDVRLNGAEPDSCASGETLRDQSRIVVILDQPFHVVVERIDPGCGEDADLPCSWSFSGCCCR